MRNINYEKQQIRERDKYDQQEKEMSKIKDR